MAKYLPYAGKNSIVEMNIGIQFALPFDQRIGESVDAIKAEFTNDFPKFDPLQMQMLTLNFGLPPFPISAANAAPTVGGFNLTKPKADGSVSRVLRVVSNVLSVHFLEYTSWKESKPLAIGYIARCLEKLGTIDKNSAGSILLRYIDRFTFDGAPQDATAALLFRADTKFVAGRILNTGNQWHCNSGWFEPFAGKNLVLNQLNVSSFLSQAAVSVVVDHNSVYSSPKAYGSIRELISGEGEQLSLESVLDRQHAANAYLLKNMLNDEMLETINLKG